MSKQMDMFDGRYPQTPGYKVDGTSRAAADAMAPQVTGLRAKAYAAFRSAGAGGWTADEVADLLGRSVLSIRPRISELLLFGLIMRNGRRRQNQSGLYADAYVATNKPGRSE
jgi:hypothetical protein